MADTDQVVDTSTDEGSEQKVVEPTPIEKRAMDMGWRPADQFDGDPDDFIDAKEFVRRQPLFDRIEQQSRQIKNVTKAMEALKTHYTQVKEVEYERALKALKEGRKTALRDGDADTFDTYDQEIQRVEEEAAKIRAAREAPIVQEETMHPEFQAWVNKNRWYNDAGYMRVFADEVGQKLAAQGMQPSDVLREVEKAVRKEFPGKFTNPNKAKAPDVDSTESPTRATRRNEIELTDQEKRVMDTLVRGGHITKEKYLADLKLIRNKE
jgi:hypothetical protein